MATQTEYLKNIPCMLVDAIISKWNVVHYVFGYILSRNSAIQFLIMTKYVSLVDTEVPEPETIHLAG